MKDRKKLEDAIASNILKELAVSKILNITNSDPEDLKVKNGSFGYNDHFAKDIYECELSGIENKLCSVELDA